MNYFTKILLPVYGCETELFLNGVKYTNRGWDWAYDLVPISIIFDPMKLKLKTISLTNLESTQHLN